MASATVETDPGGIASIPVAIGRTVLRSTTLVFVLGAMAAATHPAQARDAESEDPAACRKLEQRFQRVTETLAEFGRQRSVSPRALAGLARRQGTLIGLQGQTGCDPAPLVSILRVQAVGLQRLYRKLSVQPATRQSGPPSRRQPSQPRTVPATPPRADSALAPERPAPSPAARPPRAVSQPSPMRPPSNRGSTSSPVHGTMPLPPPAPQGPSGIPRGAATAGRIDPKDDTALGRLIQDIQDRNLGGSDAATPGRNPPLRAPTSLVFPMPNQQIATAAPPRTRPPAVLPGGPPTPATLPSQGAGAIGAPTDLAASAGGARNGPATIRSISLVPKPIDALNASANTDGVATPALPDISHDLRESGQELLPPPANPPPAVTRSGRHRVAAGLESTRLGATGLGARSSGVTRPGLSGAVSLPRTGRAIGTATAAGNPPPPSAPPPPVGPQGQGGIRRAPIFRATTNVNLRAGPSTRHAKLGLLTAGTAVAVLGRAEDGQWYQVRTRDGRDGFVSVPYLSDKQPSPSGPASQAVAAYSDRPPPDGPELVAEVERRARAGDREAQFVLGNYYLNLDIRQAVKWWSEAADTGHPGAQYNMGLALMTGRGLARNEAEGLSYWRAAAANGHPQARRALAGMRGARN